MKNPMKSIPKREQQRLLNLERKSRASGNWGPWESLPLPLGSVGQGGWAATFTTCHRQPGLRGA